MGIKPSTRELRGAFGIYIVKTMDQFRCDGQNLPRARIVNTKTMLDIAPITIAGVWYQRHRASVQEVTHQAPSLRPSALLALITLFGKSARRQLHRSQLSCAIQRKAC